MLHKFSRQLVRFLPDWAAYRVVRFLASRTQRPSIQPIQQEAMGAATVLRYGPKSQNVAWTWGDGPLVIFVHGWNGRAAQLAPLATAIAVLGFRCVAIDVTGHGSSPKLQSDWAHFMDDIAGLTQSLQQDVHAFVGHSAGAMAMMAARDRKGLEASRYVCICAPSHPFPPIEIIREKLNPTDGVLEQYRRHLAGLFDDTWENLRSGSLFAEAGSNLLLIYDKFDRFIDHSEGDKIQAICPGAHLIKTSSYGHMKVLMSTELTESVGEFLRLSDSRLADDGCSQER